MPRHLLVLLLLAGVLAACGKPKEPASAKPPALLLAPEDVRTVGSGDVAQGPVITGSIQPARRADLRAEVSAVVLQVLRENGEAVKNGELLVRLDDTAIRDSLASAEESARASGQAFEQAERQVQRLKTLQAQGMSSMQALEDAEVRRNNTQSDLAAARARVVSARQQLRRTEVRAPFDGVVSDRKVSAGDTAAIGKEMLKVIDPRSMRFEGLVSADRMHEIQLGQDVRFRVNGYPQAEFTGKVRRVDAAANSTTRQVEVLVEFADGNAPRVAGLYAEGRIAAAGRQALMLSEASLVRVGDKPFVWRVNAREKTLSMVPVQLGERDARRGEYPLRGGLAEGEQILRNPGTTLVDGQRFEFVGGAAPSAAASAASTGS
ncbi:efflux RND transporter periplasmic adaptor subunit [Piscinibacter sp. XHJ-5]|uniref:efflux RND transporter periplasmic adaptor subunit n=1 Tax=Piscinibacter sp. XHJ-5 TaxID=3037797 RepID=UPI002452CEE5|nr:efflux RND transporter periplasmic adaptor subunit [Piscinibacter sp. XHJ-5]